MEEDQDQGGAPQPYRRGMDDLRMYDEFFPELFEIEVSNLHLVDYSWSLFWRLSDSLLYIFCDSTFFFVVQIFQMVSSEFLNNLAQDDLTPKSGL